MQGTYESLSTIKEHVNSKRTAEKNGKQIQWTVKDASKAFYGPWVSDKRLVAISSLSKLVGCLSGHVLLNITGLTQ